VIFAACAAHGQSVSPPSNDNLTNSSRLLGTNVTVSGTSAGASLEAGEQKVFTNNGGTTVWYSWTAPFLASVYLRTESQHAHKSIGVFTGDRVDNLKLMATANTFLAYPGTTYHFQIDSSSVVTGAFTFSLRAFGIPNATNDHFANAMQLGGSWAATRDSIAGATLEAGEPVHRSGAAKSIWWRWTAPASGRTEVYHGESLATNITLAVYTGTSVEALTPVASGPHTTFTASAGQTYHIAAAVSAETTGDVLLTLSQSPVLVGYPAAENLLCEPHFENTSLNLTCWAVDAPIGGSVNPGSTTLRLSAGGTIWQTVATIPGEEYEVRFAVAGASALMHVSLNSQLLGIAEVPADNNDWVWFTFSGVATEPTSTLKFTAIRPWEFATGFVGFDGASFVRATEPPSIATQPRSVSTPEDGTAVFEVVVRGSQPLSYQWLFNGAPLAGANSRTLTLQSVTSDQAGDYSVVVSNAFGVVTSAVARLSIEVVVAAPVIIVQPYGDSVPVGAYHVLAVAALGIPPFNYQWFKDGTTVVGETNRHLTFPAIAASDAGTYTVRVSNERGSVISLPALLDVTETSLGGGIVRLDNRASAITNAAPVFDVDGSTPLSGSNFVAQLYAGLSPDGLRAAGAPTRFLTDLFAGFVLPKTVTLLNAPPLTNAFAQLRAWEASKGATYEEARALGGKFGRSEVFQIRTGGFPADGGIPIPPQPLGGLQSFRLEAGLPLFNVGVLRLEDRLPQQVLVWSLQGEPGFRYSIERQIGNAGWVPLMILTNITGTLTFTDPDTPPPGRVLYRSRILD
jgi:hypothetical protein